LPQSHSTAHGATSIVENYCRDPDSPFAVMAGTVTTGLPAASKAAVARFREHFPHAKVRGRHEAL